MKGLAAGTLASLLAALVLAGGSGARATHTVVMRLDDVVSLSGTRVSCTVTLGDKIAKGQKVIACFELSNGNPLVGSYAPGLAAKGAIRVVKITGPKSARPVFTRTPAAVRTPQRTVPVRFGDRMIVAGTSVGCGVGKQGGDLFIGCFRVDPKGPLPLSYGFVITNTAVGIVQYDAARRPKQVLLEHQP